MLSHLKFKSSLLAALSIGLCLVSGSVMADQLDDIAARGVLRVGATGDYMPFSGKDQKGVFIGIDAEMAAKLAEALGVKLEIVPTSWPSLMTDLDAKKFDIAMSGISISLARQKVALFSIPYLDDGKTPIARCEDVAKYQTLEQINRPEIRIVVNPGGTNEKFAKKNLLKANLTVYPDNTAIFQQIIDRKFDLMVTDAVETRYQQKLHPELCAIHPDQPFDFSQKAYLMPNDWRWKAFVDQWLSQARHDGTEKRVFSMWLTRD